ncbi:hypothetical protein [Candidatus Soleaferrea massiliensis]|uniref:hypothetical protein n=1 Tax=Candidatus Soleaferrea massiliensis TaxID=1470354 RepID=UPI00058B5756|nr:hypothetical protein [Candidatus Soleaferrea massiliensis]
MNKSNGSDGFDLCDLPDEVLSQLSLLDNSQYYIRMIMGALAIQYQFLDVQRDKLLCSTLHPECFDEACYPDTFKLQLLASLITIYALFGFYNQSEQIACEAAQAGNCDTKLTRDVRLSATILLVALIRLFQLVQTESEQNAQLSPQASQAQLQSSDEDLSESESEEAEGLPLSEQEEDLQTPEEEELDIPTT